LRRRASLPTRSRQRVMIRWSAFCGAKARAPAKSPSSASKLGRATRLYGLIGALLAAWRPKLRSVVSSARSVIAAMTNPYAAPRAPERVDPADSARS